MSQVFIQSPTHDFHFNLAAEEYFIRNLDTTDSDYIFFYINKPCVVLGKNQNVYNEVHWSYIVNNLSNISRRISGGGAVYHDLGNLNFCFLSSLNRNKINDYRFTTGKIVEILCKIGINCKMNERNAIVLANGNKISGSAQFTNRTSILSHGTLLFDSNIESIKDALSLNKAKIETKSSKSVRSEVENIRDNHGTRIKDVNQFLEMIKSEINYSNDFIWNKNIIDEITTLQKEKYESIEWRIDRAANGTIEWNNQLFTLDEGFVEIFGEKKRFLDSIQSMA